MQQPNDFVYRLQQMEFYLIDLIVWLVLSE